MLKYAFKVVSKRNAKKEFSLTIVRDFNGGYAFGMISDAQMTARVLNGKLAKSFLGHLVETLPEGPHAEAGLKELF